MKEKTLNQLVRRIRSRKVPFSVVFETTKRCNLRCLHCYQERGGEELTGREIRSILDSLQQSGTLKLTLTGGEPTLREDFLEIFSYCHQKGFAVTLFTNATHLPTGVRKAMIRNPPFVVESSLYGASSKTHDSITQLDGSFDLSLQNIRWMVGKGIRVIVKTVILTLNLHEVRRLEGLCQGLGVEFQLSFRVFPSRDSHRSPERFRLKAKEMRTFLGRKKDLFNRNWIEQEPFTKEFICNAGREACCISASGKLYPCVALPWECGDLREDSFAEIWSRSPTLKQIRSYKEEDFKTCFDCKWKDLCRFCPGMGFSEHRNMLIPSKEICKFTRVFGS
jgi:radical SAM protein with 4Fe4S-binding SPASM domain